MEKKKCGGAGGRGGNGNDYCSPSEAQSVVSVSAVVEEGEKNVFTLRWPIRTKAFRFSQASKDSGASDSRLRLL